jgi:hypothetical protein
MKNRVEFFVTKLFPPIERGQILRDEIARVTGEIFEITGAKIVDHGQLRAGHSLLQREHEIRADETGATCNKNGRWRGRHRETARAVSDK